MREIHQSEEIDALAEAIARVRAAVAATQVSAGTLWDVLAGPLRAQGLTLAQSVEAGVEAVVIRIVVRHASGQSMGVVVAVPTDREGRAGPMIEWQRLCTLVGIFGLDAPVTRAPGGTVFGARARRVRLLDAASGV